VQLAQRCGRRRLGPQLRRREPPAAVIAADVARDDPAAMGDPDAIAVEAQRDALIN
jgi:hypothetical protein